VPSITEFLRRQDRLTSLDLGTTFCALSLREAGYSVWANHEASGTLTIDIREHGNDRMRDAGVQIVSYYAIIGELMRDWRIPPSDKLFPLLDRFAPAIGMVARAHRAAVLEGVIMPGQTDIP
jgi:hypothetical protein